VTFQEPNTEHAESSTENNTAHLIVECLLAEGVEYVFGIPGEENIELIDALSTSNIRYLLTRHEQAASFMAEIYGRLTGRPGVCSATLGPGAINLQLGVADATTNSTPLVALSAQVGLDRIFKESHQAVDLVGLFRPITTWAELVPGAAAVPEMFRRAFKTAQTERPGATYLGVPEDVERAVAAPGLAPLPIAGYAPRIRPRRRCCAPRGCLPARRRRSCLSGAARPATSPAPPPRRCSREWKMRLELGRQRHVRFQNPDLVKYAESFGARGYRINAADELLPTLREALDSGGVSIIACPVDYSENLRLTDRLGELTGPF
jgi:thiamine pyrophosphate-dependent acetolactate synthase large subunit-like protein